MKLTYVLISFLFISLNSLGQSQPQEKHKKSRNGSDQHQSNPGSSKKRKSNKKTAKGEMGGENSGTINTTRPKPPASPKPKPDAN